jgi:hypothetical protein
MQFKKILKKGVLLFFICNMVFQIFYEFLLDLEPVLQLSLGYQHYLSELEQLACVVTVGVFAAEHIDVYFDVVEEL